MELNDEIIQKKLDYLGFKMCSDEGRLMLAELLLKAGAGWRSSYTEEAFLHAFGFMRSDRTPNKRGAKFLSSMFYNHSNLRPKCFDLMRLYRTP